MRSQEPITNLGQAACASADPVRSRQSAVVVPLRIDSPVAVAAGCQPMTVGVPFAKGPVTDPYAVVLRDPQRRKVPLQVRPLARWSDGSIKWLLVDFLAPRLPAGVSELSLHVGSGQEVNPGKCGVLVREFPDAVLVDSGPIAFEIDRTTLLPFRNVRAGDREICCVPAGKVILTDRRGRVRVPRVETVQIEQTGPVRTTLCLTGRFAGCRGLRFRVRLCFFAGTGLVRLRLAVHNPSRARHRGGLWDLGDRGSFFFRDLSLEINLAVGGNQRVSWKCEAEQELQTLRGSSLEIYQDSSGGENWQSRNHVNRHGKVPCRFRGYRVRGTDGQRFGSRASPVVSLGNTTGHVAASLPDFWQQFPKAMEVDGRRLRVRLFPDQWDDLFELQGGERKTHTLWLRFGTGDEEVLERFDWTQQPAKLYTTPESYAASAAVAYLKPASADPDDRLRALIREALVGDNSFFAKRETIDEYGWRNYGDVWADHEGAYYDGPPPVVSHYNNQFDVIYGAILQMMRSGDSRWFDVFGPLARHVMDIDIYHTNRDKAAYNGGMFWFTDHYLDAGSSTHRTFSRSNAPPHGRPYGGGPGSEHNFATGLLHYYYLTGDPDARDAVLGLADWVINMDDGAKNILGVVDDGRTGRAGFGGSVHYYGPCRAGANSLNVLLDAWLLSQHEPYLAKAEELVHLCIHPADDVASLELLDAEKRWSYTMFLSALARYLDIKSESTDLDQTCAYARQSLLHYAEWMVRHERPYLDHPEGLEYPTVAWAAQEFRKANVLRLAARHAERSRAAEMRERANELAERAWTDLLGFNTRTFTRALAVVMREGPLDAYFRAGKQVSARVRLEEHEFGPPMAFVSQKTRVLAQLRTIRGLSWMAVRLGRPMAWRRLLERLRHSRY